MGYIDIKRVGQILGDVRVKTIYQWAETGQIPCYKFNGVLRFKEEEIIEWADRCKRPERGSIIKALRPAAPGKDKVA